METSAQSAATKRNLQLSHGKIPRCNVFAIAADCSVIKTIYGSHALRGFTAARYYQRPECFHLMENRFRGQTAVAFYSRRCKRPWCSNPTSSSSRSYSATPRALESSKLPILVCKLLRNLAKISIAPRFRNIRHRRSKEQATRRVVLR